MKNQVPKLSGDSLYGNTLEDFTSSELSNYIRQSASYVLSDEKIVIRKLNFIRYTSEVKRIHERLEELNVENGKLDPSTLKGYKRMLEVLKETLMLHQQMADWHSSDWAGDNKQ